MRQFVIAETGQRIEPQIAYYDGYGVAERLLEGVLFEVTLDEQGNFVCNGVREEDRSYYDDFAPKKHVEWQEQIVKECERYADQLATLDGEDIEVVDEAGQPAQTPPPVIAVIPKVNFREIGFGHLIGLTIEEASVLAKTQGIERIRATMVDGVSQIVTMELRGDRLNVSIENGKISAISGIG